MQAASITGMEAQICYGARICFGPPTAPQKGPAVPAILAVPSYARRASYGRTGRACRLVVRTGQGLLSALDRLEIICPPGRLHLVDDLRVCLVRRSLIAVGYFTPAQ